MWLYLIAFYNQLLRPRWVIVKITLKPHSVVLYIYGVAYTTIISSSFSPVIVYQRPSIHSFFHFFSEDVNREEPVAVIGIQFCFLSKVLSPTGFKNQMKCVSGFRHYLHVDHLRNHNNHNSSLHFLYS